MQENATNTNAAPEKKARCSIIFDNWFGKWLIQRLSSFLVWIWLILRIFNLPLPFGQTFQREYVLIPSAITVLLMIVCGRWARLFFYPIYIFFFPGLIAGLIFRTIYKLVQLPIQASRYAYSTPVIVVFILSCLISWFISFLADNSTVQAVFTLIAHSATFILFMQIFRWASNPYKPITGIFQFISSKGSTFIEKTYIQPGMGDDGQQRKTAVTMCQWVLNAVERIYPSEAPLERGVTGFAYSGIVPLAITLFIIAYVVLALSFSFTLMRTEAAWGQQIIGIGNPPTFSDYLYFTLLSEATAVPDNISPLSVFGKFVIVWNVLTGVLLLTLLISMFTTSVGIHGESSVQRIREALEAEKQRYEHWLVLLEAKRENSTVIEGQFEKLNSDSERV